MQRAASRWTIAALVAGFALAAVPSTPAFAEDRVAELTTQLDAGNSEKTRIAAVTALGRLASKKALKPLVNALRDKSATVRAVAALGLGKLGHRAALPALRGIAKDDRDTLVRKRAKQAITAINTSNGLEDEDDDVAAASGSAAGFGRKPKALSARPELFVLVKSASDDSSGKLDKKTRKLHAEIAKVAMSGELKATQIVTTVTKDANKYGLDGHNIDVIITKLDTRTVGSYIEIEAQLRIAISDERGKLLSFLTGGAKVSVKKATYNASYLPQLRREALENAVKGLFDKLLAHLRRGAGA